MPAPPVDRPRRPIPDQLAPGGVGQTYLSGGESTAPGLTRGQQRFVMEDVLGMRQPKPGQPTIIEAEATNPIGAALRALVRALGRQGRPITAEAVESVMRVPDEVMQRFLDDTARRMAARARQRPSIEQPSFIPEAQGGTFNKLEEFYPQRAPQATDPVNEAYYYTRSPLKTEEMVRRQEEGAYRLTRTNPNEAAQEIGLSPTGVPQVDIANLATKLGRVPSEDDLKKYLDLQRSAAWTSDDWDETVKLSEDALDRVTRGFDYEEVALADEIATRFDVPYQDALLDARATLQRRATFKEELHAADELRTNPALSPDEAMLIAKAKSYKSPGQVNYRGGPLSTSRVDRPRLPEQQLGADFQDFLRDKWSELYSSNLKSVVAKRTEAEDRVFGLRPGKAAQPTPADMARARQLTDDMWPAMRTDLMETKRRAMSSAKVNVGSLRSSYIENVKDLRSKVRAIEGEIARIESSGGYVERVEALLLRKRQLEGMIDAAQSSLRSLPKPSYAAPETAGVRNQMVYMREQKRLWEDELSRVDELEPDELAELYPSLKGEPYSAAKRFIEQQIDTFDKEINAYVKKYYKGAQEAESIRGKGGISRPTEDLVIQRIERAEGIMREQQRLERMVRAAELRDELYRQRQVAKGKVEVEVEFPKGPDGGVLMDNRGRPITISRYLDPRETNVQRFIEGAE